MSIQKHPVKSKFCKLRLLCRSLAGNNVYYLTVTAPPPADDDVVRVNMLFVTSSFVRRNGLLFIDQAINEQLVRPTFSSECLMLLFVSLSL